MPAPFRFALFAAMVSLAPATCQAMDDYLRASSSAPTGIVLCGAVNGDGSRIKTAAACKKAGYDKLVAAIDKSFDAALAKTPGNIRPLIKRDQAWFNEMILGAADTVQEVDEAELRDNFIATLRRRARVLDEIAIGFGHSGLAGKWTNAFGGLIVTPAANGGYDLAVDMNAYYGSDKHRQCKLRATVTSGTGGWLNGPLPPPAAKAADTGDKAKSGDANSKSARPPAIKIRRQGDTLRVVMIDGDDGSSEDRDDCDYLWQITGTYFASGKSGTTDKIDTSFVVPTFDCTRPDTATEEEICSDPDLAENDQRLNRAWKALLPRLDDATRHALTDDQRNWVHAQAEEYPEFLHPAWEKQTSEMHFTANARDHVDALQRERIALLEGFDDKRTGLAGVWLAYNAVIKITVDKDGQLKAKGWKWDQGDWKAGCDYEMSGAVSDGTFRSDEKRKNPDTLERDHAMLIVNRLDDDFAKKRTGANDTDEQKCKRRLDISSTARLFPALSSPDIDNMPGEIR
ncbi:lysozyme inhibitor LprI family protein [Bradyrhizobium sp. CCGUVB23]|uniref:lysozyme inhibitor LprI family protein n=1 Tax=Bradyrhizobium sp. CCGUVB23 TaxID=2949630 RepID=UPI0020B1790F|nr:lysozyme inhibitor LprI family protein [Bradyrhizobium sp. CCGUVB23]MCP3460235.1 lysozyme inhibitor LprI family protein [Bradyrhizobium sp. CCGUVB23]